MRSLFLLLLSCLPLFAHLEPSGASAISQMITTAKSTMEVLTPEQRKLASFPFDSEERESWHYIPRDDRKGISLGALTRKQKEAVTRLVDTGLSRIGMVTARQIIALEQYLAEKENNPVLRNPEKYYLSIFGTPADNSTWGWRFEGHHLSFNYTIIDGKELIFTPAFFGTNPAEILDGKSKGQRPLGLIEDKARTFAQAAMKNHPSILFTEAPPKEIISRADRIAKSLEPVGIKGADLKKPVQHQLQKVINALSNLFAPGVIPETFIDASKSTFAWGGSMERGKPHYFRIQSEGILIEYANTQNNANHAHLVIRFTENDFGRDLLKEHLEHAH